MGKKRKLYKKARIVYTETLSEELVNNMQRIFNHTGVLYKWPALRGDNKQKMYVGGYSHDTYINRVENTKGIECKNSNIGG